MIYYHMANLIVSRMKKKRNKGRPTWTEIVFVILLLRIQHGFCSNRTISIVVLEIWFPIDFNRKKSLMFCLYSPGAYILRVI